MGHHLALNFPFPFSHAIPLLLVKVWLVFWGVGGGLRAFCGM